MPDDIDDPSFPPDPAARWRRTLLGAAVGCAVLVAVIGLLTAPDQLWWATDQQHSRQAFASGVEHTALAFVARWFGYLTVPTVLRVVTVLAAVLLWRRGRRFAALWWVMTMLVAGAVAIALRYAVARPRPHWPGSGPVVEGYTFPSGHATNAAVFAGCVLVVFWPYLRGWARTACAAAALAFFVGVGASRVVLGVHHVSDVLAAWLVALSLLTTMLAVAAVPRVRTAVTARTGPGR